MMQETTQVSTAVRPSALGAAADTKLNMLTSTRNRVTSRDIRPQTTVNSVTGRGERGEGRHTRNNLRGHYERYPGDDNKQSSGKIDLASKYLYHSFYLKLNPPEEEWESSSFLVQSKINN